MPRFFCDYCDAYLTHDSAPGRQQHIRGWKHRENFKAYYQTFAQGWEQEQQTKEMQKQMQMMQQMQAGGMIMPPQGAPGQMPGQPFGGPGQPFPPQHLMGIPPPNMMMGQQFPPQMPMGMPPNIMQPVGPGGPPGGPPGPNAQFRSPPNFQPPPMFPEHMQAGATLGTESMGEQQ